MTEKVGEGLKGQDVILGLLMEKARTGYEIKQEFESLFPDFFVATFGTIYPTLNKMEKEKYITKEVIHQEGKPSKNVYAITEKGKEVFYDYLKSPLEQKMIRFDFFMRLYFNQYITSEELVKWIDQEIEQTKITLQRLEETIQRSDQWNEGQLFCWELGIKINRIFLESLKEAREKFSHSS
ncbi:PadR family transcriptional regulator [Heliorestis convoluta]|uniref:PadR family transcriptional regulator n=1 Tax=Heliorestis convoluta TaxID=356322 RepID=A0A5Q2N7Z9_9FIRM|nr:PadR family transcriptional regulator [Heliorestis convoluta]QGG48380.1 PadR family transcriptional regulator [Heliorestis convoluta]